ncbi:NADP-dependent oxidoreductase [Rhodobacteraceae bacterium RKSG542]|uniref:NADP-dependent oxidoreductase n=1 Tax=Pseudovibrio flavus TaxID=2529854 RepID=UPI0012BD3A3F|nr:NADP-dependent oxidoreductase [Pseudovibrio flavus]MTI18594.1 NADP-dependent oxidoreductase [Pseudovibrio flavus]
MTIAQEIYPVNNTRILLKQRPFGMIKPEDFEIVEETMPALAAGKARVRVVYLSLDPAMRGWVSADENSYVPPVPLGSTMRGLAVGVIEESNAEGLKRGDWVSGFLGWTKLIDVEPKDVNVVPQVVPMEAYMGILGLAGATAYYGLMEVGEPKAGQTLCVTGAAGSVGSLVGQLAKANGLRVIGIAGSEEKCKWLTEELGFDAALNYKTDDLEAGLRAFAPEGLDLHFENVGGAPLQAALHNMKAHGKLIICGLISNYNATEMPSGPELSAIIKKRLTMQGFVMTDHLDRFGEFFQKLGGYMSKGQLKYRLDIVDGLESAPTAINRLFVGSNTGKLTIRVSEL